jgi:hypothetical protein
MPSKNQTSVVLTKKAQALKEEAVLTYGGLKHVLSAALELFHDLPIEEQIKRINQVRRDEAEDVVREAEATARARIKSRHQKDRESR